MRAVTGSDSLQCDTVGYTGYRCDECLAEEVEGWDGGDNVGGRRWMGWERPVGRCDGRMDGRKIAICKKYFGDLVGKTSVDPCPWDVGF